MKIVFTVSTGCDGLQTACFTNIKALHKYIENEQGLTDGRIDISTGSRIKEAVYSYANLVKIIRANQKLNRFQVATIYSSLFENIEICQLGVCNK